MKMDYSAVSQAAKRFEQKTEVNHEIKEVMQRVITALKEVWISNVETPFYPFWNVKNEMSPYLFIKYMLFNDKKNNKIINGQEENYI